MSLVGLAILGSKKSHILDLDESIDLVIAFSFIFMSIDLEVLITHQQNVQYLLCFVGCLVSLTIILVLSWHFPHKCGSNNLNKIDLLDSRFYLFISTLVCNWYGADTFLWGLPSKYIQLHAYTVTQFYLLNGQNFFFYVCLRDSTQKLFIGTFSLM